MKIEQKSENCWRIRKMINGKNITMYFDHYPSDVDIALALADKANTIDLKAVRQSFDVAATEYLAIKNKVLSPATSRSYKAIQKMLPDSFKGKDIDAITQVDVQLVINNMIGEKAPKTIHNYHGFISAVLKEFRPNFILSTKLPQEVEYEAVTPLEKEIKIILSKVKNTKYSVPFQLGVLGMRRSEICALLPSDIKDNSILVCRAKVEGEKGFVIKEYPKTKKSRRWVYIPDSLKDEILKNKEVYSGTPSMLIQTLHKYQKELGFQETRFHDLRAFYASYAHSCGIPDAIIMANGGWSTDHVMKKLYRRALQNDVEYYQEALSSDLLGKL